MQYVRCNFNEPGGIRTHDLRIKSPLLYRLSYGLNDDGITALTTIVDGSRAVDREGTAALNHRPTPAGARRRVCEMISIRRR